MTSLQRMIVGPDGRSEDRGRSAHGRWGAFYHRGPDDASPARAAFHAVQDAERLAFALAEGEGAAFLAECVAEFLWTQPGEVGAAWPGVLYDWLADAPQWEIATAGAVRFACGRLDRAPSGGRMALAWLGMEGVCLFGARGHPLMLDTSVQDDDVWTPGAGRDLPALHSFSGTLYDAARLVVLSRSAAPLIPDLPEMTTPEIGLALGALSDGARADLAVFDLWIEPVVIMGDQIVVRCRWVEPSACELAWEQLPEATGYRIEEAPTPDFGAPSLLAELTDGRQVSYRFAPPPDGARYYRVVPLVGGALGAPSAPVAALPLTLPVPVLVPIRWAREDSLRLSWTPIPAASGYEVEAASEDDFAPPDAAIVYRGERAEVTLPGDTALGRYFRVRAINALYAPGMPSAWSEPVRAPSRLATPVFSEITARRLAWERVPGARTYEIRVTPVGRDPEQGESIFSGEAACPAADGPASYQVRALRGPDDERTASAWSVPVTIAPHPAGADVTRRALAIPALIAVALAALAVGFWLGVAGLEAYRMAQATTTPTPLDPAAQAATRVARMQAETFAALAPQLATALAGAEADNAALRATQDRWIAAEATRAAQPTTCLVIERPAGLRLPVYAAPDEASRRRAEDLPAWAAVRARLEDAGARWRAVIGVTAAGETVGGWVRLPDEVDEAALYGGVCDPARLPVWGE